MSQRIVILGGGTGGTLVANLLAKRLSASQANITVVSDSTQHLYQPGWLYVPFGWQAAEALSRDERRLLNPQVTLLHAPVTGLDLEGRVVKLEGGQTLPYDSLVIATGSRPTPEDVEGLQEAGHHFYTEAAALALKAALESFKGGRIVVGVGGLPHKCPVAPLEFTFLLDDYLRRKGLRDATSITYTYPINRPFTIESVSKTVVPLLAAKNIAVETFFNLESVNVATKTAISMEGTELPFDLLVMIPPHRGAAFLEGLPFSDPQGWVATDRSSLAVKGQEGVYALGDATDIPISKAGSTAHYQAPVVVEHIVARVEGRAPNPKHAVYDGKVICFLESGHDRASILSFNYAHPPVMPAPNAFHHYGKMAFNRAYWYLVPTGLI